MILYLGIILQNSLRYSSVYLAEFNFNIDILTEGFNADKFFRQASSLFFLFISSDDK